MESTELEPVNLGVLVLKELGAKWLAQMVQCFKDNTRIIALMVKRINRKNCVKWRMIQNNLTSKSYQVMMTILADT